MELRTPYTMVVSGQTGSGKTVFVDELIRNHEILHDKPFDKIIYAYSIMQPIYLRLQADVPNLELVDGFPANLEDYLGQGNTLLVLDDLMLEMENDKRIAELFTKMRHMNLSSIFIVQNLYHNSRYMRTVTRNAQYLVVFPNPRDMSMILTLGRQIYPLNSKYLPDAFSQATRKPYGYLFIDLKPDTDPKFRLREGIMPEEQLYVYVPK